MYHVSGCSRDVMDSFFQWNALVSSGLNFWSLAISVHRPSARLSLVMLVATILLCGLVSRKFHANTARTNVFPGFLHAFMHSRVCFGNAVNTSACHASGSSWITSRQKRSGSCAHSFMMPEAAVFFTPR